MEFQHQRLVFAGSDCSEASSEEEALSNPGSHQKES